MNFDRRLFGQLRQVRWLLILTLIASLLTSAAILGQAKALSRTIRLAFLQHQDLQATSPFLFIFLLLTVGRAFFHWLSQEASSRMASRIKVDLRRRVSEHLIGLGPYYVRSRTSGELTNTLLNGIDALDAYFSQYLPQLFLAVLIPVLILVFVFPIDVLSGFVFLITAPLIPVFMVLIGDVAQTLTKRQWRTLSRMSAYLLDVLQGLTTLKVLGRSRDQVQKIAEITEAFRHRTMRVLRVAFLSALALELLATISTAIIAVEIGLRLLYGKMAFESALFILILAPEFYLPLRQLGTRFHAGLEGVSAAQSLFRILDEPVVSFRGTAKRLASPAFAIEFQNVSYTYSGGTRPAVEAVSFRIEPKSMTALVGPSGAGKSTLIGLLLRFIVEQEGAILVDGEPLGNFDPTAWRRHVAWVPQAPYLFHTSVYENIRLARPGATEAEVVRAARLAHLHEFITSLPDGYQTQVGERGTRLSGGQAQRLAVARAFLKDSAFIILDEPTSHLDPQGERLLSEAIHRLVENRTVLLIAHRLSTVRKADRIVVLARGRVAEIGTHRDLLQRGRFYKELVGAAEGRDHG